VHPALQDDPTMAFQKEDIQATLQQLSDQGFNYVESQMSVNSSTVFKSTAWLKEGNCSAWNPIDMGDEDWALIAILKLEMNEEGTKFDAVAIYVRDANPLPAEEPETLVEAAQSTQTAATEPETAASGIAIAGSTLLQPEQHMLAANGILDLLDAAILKHAPRTPLKARRDIAASLGAALARPQSVGNASQGYLGRIVNISHSAQDGEQLDLCIKVDKPPQLFVHLKGNVQIIPIINF
jgi:hypothetical protein